MSQATPDPDGGTSLRDLRTEELSALGPKVAAVAPDIPGLAASFAYGEIWPRPLLSQRDRSIATIAVLIATQCREELRLHVLRGLGNGLSKEELGEIFVQLIPYVGFPRVVSAAEQVADLVKRADVSTEAS